MSQTQHPLYRSPSGGSRSLHCVCGDTIELAVPGGDWVLAAHRAQHNPMDVIAIPEELCDTLLLAADAATGWTEVLAPAFTADLQMAINIIAATRHCDDHRPLVHSEMLALLATTFGRSALALSTTVADEALVSEVDAVAYDLNDLMSRSLAQSGRPGAEPLGALRISTLGPQVTDLLEACRRWIEPPLLTLAPPAPSKHEVLGGRPAAELTHELADLPSALVEEEARFSCEVGRLRFTAQPLPVASDSSLERIADSVLDFHLARLRATHLAESLVASEDIELRCWASDTAERIVVRMTQLIDDATQLLLAFES